MNSQRKKHTFKQHYAFTVVMLLVMTLSSCSKKPEQNPAPGESTSPDAALTEVFQAALLTAEAQAGISQSEMPAAPAIDEAAEAPAEAESGAAQQATLDPAELADLPMPIQSDSPLPMFQSSKLAPDTTSKAYIENTCVYLQNRWGAGKSEPGTIVVPVMYHSIVDDSKEITDNMFVHISVHHEYMNTAKAYDFEAIDMAQLADFLYNNAKIPRLSVINIVDDRHKKAYFNEFFFPYYEAFQWKVINAWISTPESSEELWQEQQELNNAGWVDYQAHGVVHNIPIQEWSPDQTITTDVFGTLTADEYVFHEISDPVTIFQERFNKPPIAYIWPGGGFSIKGVEVARQAGYKVGFSVFQRGPLMYNWVPLGAQEQSVNAPLFVLPRYWSYAINYQLEDIIQISQEAAAYAQQNRQMEIDWHNTYCPDYPPL